MVDTVSDGRHNPYDIDLEQSALGAALADPKHLDTLAADLAPDVFHDPYHGRIMAKMLHLRGSGAVTVRTLAAAMKSDPAWDETGQDAYLDALRTACPAFPPVGDYCRILNDLAARRALVAIGQGLVEDAYLPPDDISTQSLIAGATEAIFSIGATGQRPEDRPSEVADCVVAEAEAALRGEKPPSVTTGLKKLDKAMGGIMAQELILVPARSGMGKSALMGGMALEAAKAGTPVLFFTKEMSSKQIVQRLLCDIDHGLKGDDTPAIEGWKFRAHCLSNYEIDRLRRAREVLNDLPLRFVDDGGLTMGQITSRSRAFASRYKGHLGLIVVDFLQIVKDDTTSKNDTRENVVSRLAYAHKELAKRLDWGVMAAVQMLNKRSAIDRKTSDLPTAEDIRESGALEQAADIIISPFRRGFFHKQKEPIVPHDRDEWKTWKEKMSELENEFWIRGFKLRGGDPSSLNIELWASMASSAIRDDRPGRYRMPVDGVADEELAF